MQAQIIEKLKVRVEDLEIKIFGKKKDKKKSKGNGDGGESNLVKDPRTTASYRKPIPNESEITKTQEYPIANCPDCGAPLTDLKITTQYKIELAFLDRILKEIEKQNVQTGYCPKCKNGYQPSRYCQAKYISAQTSNNSFAIQLLFCGYPSIKLKT